MGPIALAFQYLQYSDVVIEQFGEKSFEHFVICLAAEQPFERPVEADEFSFDHGFILRTVFMRNDQG